MSEPACEVLHGVPCETDELELPAGADAELPAGDLLELGRMTSTLFWKDQDNQARYHEFDQVTVYATEAGVIYLVGNFKLTEFGFENTGDEE